MRQNKEELFVVTPFNLLVNNIITSPLIAHCHLKLKTTWRSIYNRHGPTNEWLILKQELYPMRNMQTPKSVPSGKL